MGNFFKEIVCNSIYGKAACVLYDQAGCIRYLIANFQNKQLYDGFLASVQGKNTARVSGVTFTLAKANGKAKHAYIGKSIRAKDENCTDGISSIIYCQNQNIIRVHKGEDFLEKIFLWLQVNLRTAILPEWKGYVINELLKKGLVYKCGGFDSTGKAPDVYTLSPDINEEYLRKIKKSGLADGSINMPVKESIDIPKNMGFVETTTKYIVPNIVKEDCWYNEFDPIDTMFKSLIIKEDTKKRSTLYPEQQKIAQAILNAFVGRGDEKKNLIVLNGGTGVGKTYISIKIALAIYKRIIKGEDFRVTILSPGHLVSQWKRELNEALNPVLIFPKIYEVNKPKDVLTLSKKPKGFEVIICSRDTAKRSWYVESCLSKTRFEIEDVETIQDTVSESDIYENTVIIKETMVKDSKLKVHARQLEYTEGKKVILYKPIYDNEKITGYKVVSSSKKVLECFSNIYKSMPYHLIIDDIEVFKKNILSIIGLIKNEKVKNSGLTDSPLLFNGLICPHCGGLIYPTAHHAVVPRSEDDAELREPRCYKYLTKEDIPKEKTVSASYNSHFVKADGTALSIKDHLALARGTQPYIVVKKKVKIPYVDVVDETPLSTEKTGNELSELMMAKAGRSSYKLLIMKADCIMFGAKNSRPVRMEEVNVKPPENRAWQKEEKPVSLDHAKTLTGERDLEIAIYMKRVLGKKCIDFLIVDEFNYGTPCTVMYMYKPCELTGTSL